jgi:ribosomal protein S18 acetylase RimI-like enzyme
LAKKLPAPPVGLGQLLMNEVLAAARQSRVIQLFLKVQDANQSAIEFYLRNGFRVVGEEPLPATRAM